MARVLSEPLVASIRLRAQAPGWPDVHFIMTVGVLDNFFTVRRGRTQIKLFTAGAAINPATGR
jgi:hypothetical protein